MSNGLLVASSLAILADRLGPWKMKLPLPPFGNKQSLISLAAVASRAKDGIDRNDPQRDGPARVAKAAIEGRPAQELIWHPPELLT